MNVKLYFYLPSPGIVESVPSDINSYWGWINQVIKISPASLPGPAPNGSTICTWVGPYNWTIQSFMYLRSLDYPCTLTDILPDNGIIFAHSDFLSSSDKPSSKKFIVEIKPDRKLSCYFANFVIVQCRLDPLRNWLTKPFIHSAYVPYWPQPSLIPRDPNRGARFENVYYMGNASQFLENVNELENEIAQLGLTLKMPPRAKWHDYSEADVVVAVRPLKNLLADFSGDRDQFRKPASKLINAWLAGVPAILSPEPSYKDIKLSDLDFLEASNVSEIIEQLKLLAANPKLRNLMRHNSLTRASEISPNKNLQAWANIIGSEIIPIYLKWLKSPCLRLWFMLTRSVAYHAVYLARKMRT